MSEKRKKYNKKFKQKAVELSYARGSATEITEELGIRPQMLYRWRQELNRYDKNSFPGHGKQVMADQERVIARLERELRDAKRWLINEVKFLKNREFA